MVLSIRRFFSFHFYKQQSKVKQTLYESFSSVPVVMNGQDKINALKIQCIKYLEHLKTKTQRPVAMHMLIVYLSSVCLSAVYTMRVMAEENPESNTYNDNTRKNEQQ